MSKQTNEHAFETQVEETLLGVSGWQSGTNAEWNVERALFPAQVCTFLDTTQPKLWAEMRALHGDGLEKLLIAALVKELDVKGTLHVLRHGFKFYGKIFRIGTFKPARGSVALPAEPYHDHSSGFVPPGQARHGGPSVRAERPAGGDMRVGEPAHWSELASCGAAVPEGSRSTCPALPIQDSRIGALRRRPG